jgi:uncharacterized protein YjbI with pentapeptide repeats
MDRFGRSADLAGASLRGATLGGPAYPRSNLKAGLAGLGPVDLRGADLQDANLNGADLKGARNSTNAARFARPLEAGARHPPARLRLRA